MFSILLFSYVFIINVISFGMYAIDKRNAHYNCWRLSEALLLGLAVIGGAYGAGAGMILFRHKTLRKSFLATVTISFILWIVLLSIICVLN